MFGRIIGTGSNVPDQIWTNDDIARMVDTNDEWISTRTGIKRRHIIKDETTVSMAAKASQNAVQAAGISPEEIDLILFATSSSNVIFPCAACELQKEIGAVNATGYDMSAACSGFLFAYNTAQCYIQSQLAKTVLIVGAESLSNVVNWTDRSTCILFGDGAGAAILQADESASPIVAVTHSDGSKGKALTCISRHQAALEDLKSPDTYLQMDGQAVFKFAIRKVPEVIKETLAKAGIEKEEVDLFILHQANSRIVEAVAKRLGIDIARFPMNISDYGNTSAASIPILLDELVREGKVQKGMKIVLAGFGAGLSWGATYLEY